MSILVIDFGSQYSHLICRRIRELNVYSELCACTISRAEVEKFQPTGIILSGGPSSVYEDGSPHLNKEVWEYIDNSGIPVLGICYGLQEMMYAHGGRVERGPKREFGSANLGLTGVDSKLFKDVVSSTDSPLTVWMSHGDKVTQLAPGFRVVAVSENSEMCAVENWDRKFYGLQFHPEVTHTKRGLEILKNFAVDICKCAQTWSMSNFIKAEIEKIHELVGPEGHVIGAVSGGVDSSVGASLLHTALGRRFHPVLVDTGLLRKDEAVEVKGRLESHIPGLKLHVIDASDKFLSALAGVDDPELKRKICGNAFVEVFDDTVQHVLNMEPSKCFLLQGTLYPDVIESVSYKGPSHTIKTHHNVGGLPDKMKMKIIEPFRLLFKDEVRKVGLELGLHEDSVFRHPFPGPGLVLRIVGPVTREDIKKLQDADAIYIEELKAANEYNKIAQAFAVLLPSVKTVGIMGDCRTYEAALCLRAVESSDFMTADWYKMPYDLLGKISTRIVNEVRGINRVMYDVSSKPPSTIEFL